MHKKSFTQTQIIALGFFLMISTGTILLMLPISSKSREWTSLLDAVFTATSCSCVTGLVTVDTYTHWSLFGQLVILMLIQIGGLGFMTIATLFSFALRRKISLRERGILQESYNGNEIGGIVRLVKLILKGTFLVESIGAVLLAVRFIPLLGSVPEGIYYAVFHSISAFCNAGFDLMGRFEQFSSLVMFESDIYINLVLIALIVIGGIGFVVWRDMLNFRLNFRKYSLHSKIVLVTTAILLFGGAAAFYLMERNGVFAGNSVPEGLVGALFASATARTAGFNTVDTAAMSEGSKLLNVCLMLVGGSPGSTAGGIKTTTIAVLFIAAWSNVWHEPHMNVFGRRLESDAARRASAIFMINLSISLAASILLSVWNHLPVVDTMFEAFSAMGTVGMTVGITRDITVLSKILIAFMMYCGRVGSLSFALSLSQRKKNVPVTLPEEKISIG